MSLGIYRMHFTPFTRYPVWIGSCERWRGNLQKEKRCFFFRW